jgi:hypothetical protein
MVLCLGSHVVVDVKEGCANGGLMYHCLLVSTNTRTQHPPPCGTQRNLVRKLSRNRKKRTILKIRQVLENQHHLPNGTPRNLVRKLFQNRKKRTILKIRQVLENQHHLPNPTLFSYLSLLSILIKYYTKLITKFRNLVVI